MDGSHRRSKKTISLLHGVVSNIIAKKWQRRHLITTFLSAALCGGIFFITPMSLAALALSEAVLVGMSIALYRCRQRDIRADSDDLARLDAILNIITDGVIEVDSDFCVLYCNEQAETWLNTCFEQIKGRNLWECFPEAMETSFYPTYQGVMKERIPGETQEFYPPLNSYLYARAFPTESGGIAIYFTDETQRVRQEEELRQQQKINAIGQLTGGVAHDFNNALQVINGMSEVLSEQLADYPEALKQLALIQQAGERSAHLTQQLLAFSRRQTLAPAYMDLNRHIEALTPMLRSTLGETINLVIKTAAEPVCIHVDAHELDNALLNLAINARDAMPEGGTLRLTIGCQRLGTQEAGHYELEEGQFVTLDITDTGAGIPDTLRERIFEPFFTTKGDGKGTGLGLSAVYGFVRQSKGHVLVQSAPNKGTTFRLLLPQCHDDIDNVSTLSSPPSASPTVNQRRRVLVVEDNDMVRNYVTTVLDGLGYMVTAVGSADAAIGKARHARSTQRPFQLVVSDVVLPEGQVGPKLLRTLRKDYWPKIPAILMSGYTYDHIQQSDLNMEYTQFLEKPFSHSALLSAIRALKEDSHECSSKR